MARGDDFVLAAWLALCLLLGGSSYGGWVPNAVLQLAGTGVLCWIAADARRRAAAWPGRAPAAMLAAWVGWGALTLVPLPAWLWVHAGGRGFLPGDYRLLGVAPPTRPLSLDPDRTLASLVAAIPFAATLLLASWAGGRARRLAAGAVVAVALGSVPLGALQLLGGGGSAWYPYAPTSVGGMVGAFANANHLATLLAMALPFAAAIARGAGRWAWAGASAFLLLGIVVDGSVAGMLLAVPATLASVALRRNRGRGAGRRSTALAAVGAAALGAALVAVAPVPRGTDPAARATSWRLTARAARDFLPFGAGPGSFRHLYPRYEDPRAVTPEFNVHAHDDYLEVALEAGLPGIALMLAALAWIVRRSWAVWARGGPSAVPARAASVALGLLLLHELVDFPARTAALGALAGFCVALLRAAPARA